jgi:hypothetical protein
MSQEQGLVWLTRLGFAARGFLYLVIAWLAIGTGRAEDLTGALEYLRGERALLMIILAGFLAYGFWRVTDALFNSEGHGEGKKGALGRVGAGASGIIYLFLAWQAWRFLKGHGGGSEGGTQEQAGTVMNHPAPGRLVANEACDQRRLLQASPARHSAPKLGEVDGARRLWRARGDLPRHRNLPDFRGPQGRSERGRRNAGRAALDG